MDKTSFHQETIYRCINDLLPFNDLLLSDYIPLLHFLDFGMLISGIHSRAIMILNMQTQRHQLDVDKIPIKQIEFLPLMICHN